jgi:hypothetical protein
MNAAREPIRTNYAQITVHEGKPSPRPLARTRREASMPTALASKTAVRALLGFTLAAGLFACGGDSLEEERTSRAGTGGSSTGGHPNTGGASGSSTSHMDAGGASGGAGGASETGGAAGTAGSGGSSNEADAGPAAEAGTIYRTWPNEVSSANSDAWLREHHTELEEIHPRFLVLDFANQYTTAQVKARFEQQKKAMMEGSRYHGYSDPSANPFLIYELAHYVNLKDGSSELNSAKMPRLDTGGGNTINFSQLFTQKYTDYIHYADPNDPSRNLSMCELFDRGFINDIFIAFDKQAPDNAVPEIIENKQMYTDTEEPKPGQFDPNAGNGSSTAADRAAMTACGRSIRIGFLEMNGILGNSLQVNAHNYEHIGDRALPSFGKMFNPFANFDLNTRLGTSFSSWYGICNMAGVPSNCMSYPSQNSVTYKDPTTKKSVTISKFNQGCGNGHFPPNGRQDYDQTNTTTVLSTCEHYGLHDGPDGADLQTKYNVGKLDQWKDEYEVGTTGGAWYMYWFQNWPGLHNNATLPDGTPMKNWWVYLYY